MMQVPTVLPTSSAPRGCSIHCSVGLFDNINYCSVLLLIASDCDN
jgi:hypothetical protein